ncbi:hypothetical protein D9613_007558 [Agrocybe pediades]|uniref:VWFA domain-containing protein n=1 Tax=Agrocybe pediades TaxID=84607 RepID=A0A8H4QN08_9AGAR|nr:hypothetical protein D9613_007558 [Agrocybe pediades]
MPNMEHPTCSTPVGGHVQINVPPGWYTYISGLSRNTTNQMIRLRIKEGNITNTEFLNGDFGKANETMKLRRTHEGSYAILRSAEEIVLTLDTFYSTDPKVKDRRLENPENGSKGLTIMRAETPPHMHPNFPDYVTFFVFVQDSKDQQATQYAPLFNDAVCTVNMIKGTGLDHRGEPLDKDNDNENEKEHEDEDEDDDEENQSAPLLDLLFLQDCTGSQQPYIKAATDSILKITNRVSTFGKLKPGGLRTGLIAFRDVGEAFITKSFGFSSDISVMQANLRTLKAYGGGDGPEDVTAALDAALASAWRSDAIKMVILISDAPPHGIGEPNDKGKSSVASHPCNIARRMAELGITIHFISCEPTLSTHYKYAYDFYRSITNITGGLLLPLVGADGLADYIIASSLERIELEALVADHGKSIARRVLYSEETVDALVKEYHAKFTARAIEITSLDVEPFYKQYEESLRNIAAYTAWVDMSAAPHLSVVPGSRVLPKFASGSVSPAVKIIKGPITEEQSSRVVKLSVTRNAEVGPGRMVARPCSEPPSGNSIKVNIPAGWFAFVSGLSRATYNQTIKLQYNDGKYTNTEFLTSELGSTDDIMRLKRTREGFYVFASSKDINIQLETSFFWSTANVKGQALDDPKYASKKLKDVETQTPMHLRDDFPDYVTYFILAEDQPDSEQVAGVPDFNDTVAIVNLIKNTPMVFKSKD